MLKVMQEASWQFQMSTGTFPFSLLIDCAALKLRLEVFLNIQSKVHRRQIVWFDETEDFPFSSLQGWSNKEKISIQIIFACKNIKFLCERLLMLNVGENGSF